MRRWLTRISLVVSTILGSFVGVHAQEANSSAMTGSVLVFPKFIAGAVVVGQTNTGAPILEPKSSFTVSVTCPPEGRCTRGNRVRLAGRWVCPPSAGFLSPCDVSDFELATTVKGTITFNPDNVGTRTDVEVPEPPCELGYLIVWVISDFSAAIKFDGLSGAAVLRRSNGSASAYAAIPIQAVSTLATGEETDVNGDGSLDFDGETEYKAVTNRLAGPIRFTRSKPVAGTTLGRIDTILTLMTLDTRASRSNPTTFVDFRFYNENEVVLSASHDFVCWTEAKLTQIDKNLDEFFGIGSHTGLFETSGAEQQGGFGSPARPVTVLGIAETIERNSAGAIVREYAYSLTNGGDLTPTIFEP